MEEENKQTSKEQPIQETSEENSQNAFNKAEIILKRMEDANRKAEENLKHHEEILARALLSGKSFAGSAPVEKHEETPKEYAEAVMSGKIKAK